MPFFSLIFSVSCVLPRFDFGHSRVRASFLSTHIHCFLCVYLRSALTYLLSRIGLAFFKIFFSPRFGSLLRARTRAGGRDPSDYMAAYPISKQFMYDFTSSSPLMPGLAAAQSSISELLECMYIKVSFRSFPHCYQFCPYSQRLTFLVRRHAGDTHIYSSISINHRRTFS